MGAIALLVAGAAPARAEEQPAILKAYGLDWIERVNEEAWPQQDKTKRPVICLLDTGVAVTPDTPADNPEGPIVARLSVEDPPAPPENLTDADRARGFPQGNTFQHLHGTRMAAIIGAPRNGSGTVGIFPQARIVSVRVTIGAEVYINPADIELGVRHCGTWADNRGLRVASVVMAESLYDQRKQDTAGWESGANWAAQLGGNFVAAVGNRPDAALVAPLAAKSILAVGAGDDSGAFCPGVPHSVGQFVGPGCSQLTPGWYEGSSSATAAVGALVAVVATRQPGLNTSQIRQVIEAAAVADGAGSFRVDGQNVMPGFQGLVAEPAVPVTLTPELVVARETTGVPTAVPEREVKLWRPGVLATWRERRLRIVRTAYRGRGVLVVRLPGSAATRTVNGHSAVLRSRSRPAHVEVWAEGSVGQTWRSLSRRVKVTR